MVEEVAKSRTRKIVVEVEVPEGVGIVGERLTQGLARAAARALIATSSPSGPGSRRRMQYGWRTR